MFPRPRQHRQVAACSGACARVLVPRVALHPQTPQHVQVPRGVASNGTAQRDPGAASAFEQPRSRRSARHGGQNLRSHPAAAQSDCASPSRRPRACRAAKTCTAMCIPSFFSPEHGNNRAGRSLADVFAARGACTLKRREATVAVMAAILTESGREGDGGRRVGCRRSSAESES